MVVVEAQLPQPQGGEVAQLSGDGASQLVVVEAQAQQIGEVAQLSGDGASQSVAVEVQVRQHGEVSQFRRDTGQLVFVEI